PTRQTPVNGTLLGAFVAIALLGSYLWIAALQTLVLFQVLILAWAVSLLGGALFPFLRERLFESATAGGAISGVKLGVSTLMALGSASLFYAGYVLWNDPIAAGHSPLAVGILIGLTASGMIVYFLAVFIRRRQGIDLSRSFREIPVE